MRARLAVEAGHDQVVHLLAAARARPEVPEPEHVGGPQHDQLEPEGGRIGFQDQLLGALVVAVAARAAAREILGHRRIGLAPPVVDPEGRDVHQPAHAGEPHRLGDVAGAAEIDVEGGAERLLHAAADQPGGVHDGVGAVRLDGLDQRRAGRARPCARAYSPCRRASGAGNRRAARDRRTPPSRRARARSARRRCRSVRRRSPVWSWCLCYLWNAGP